MEPEHHKRHFYKDRGSPPSCTGSKASKTLGIIGKEQNTRQNTILPLCYCRVHPVFGIMHSLAPQLKSSRKEEEEIQRKATRMSAARELLYEEILSISGDSRVGHDQGTQALQCHIEG